MAVRWFERWAWTLFLAPLLFMLVEAGFGLAERMPPDANHFEPLAGRSWEATREADPGLAAYVGMAAVSTYVNQVLLGLFMAVVAATAFRRGERWAWFLLASVVPAVLGTAALRVALYDTNTFPFVVPFLVLAGLGLLLPLRLFFGARGGAPSPPTADPWP